MTARTTKSQKERDQAEQQIDHYLREVDFDTKEYPIEIIVNKYLSDMENDENEIFIPDYQRDFVWDKKRQSRFIESVLIGLPIPYLFVADVTEKDARLEVVDGSQRIRTLAAFMNDELELCGLEKLKALNGFKYSDLEISRQRRFKRRTLRLIELTEKADEEVRRDIFERINTGSDVLKPMEIRRGVGKGPFGKFLRQRSENDLFNKLAPVSEPKKKRGEREELILRFFAYSDAYEEFDKSVLEFMTTYFKKMNLKTDFTDKRQEFELMLKFVKKHFAFGFAKILNGNSTPRIRFEAISVGAILALRNDPNLSPKDVNSWLESDDFKLHTTSDASNSRPRVKARIEYVRDKLLGV